MNEIIAFQSYVLESAYRVNSITLEHYVTKSVNIWEDENMHIDAVLLLMGHIQKNRKAVEKFLDDDLFWKNLEVSIDAGLITEEGLITDRGVDFSARMGFNTLTSEEE